MFRNKPHTCQRHLEGSNKILCIPGLMEASGIWLQNLHRTGETDSWRAQTKLCVQQEPGERSSIPTRHRARFALSVLESQANSFGVGQQWASGQIRREHSPSHQQKIVFKIYWAGSHPSEENPVSTTISLSHQEASISLLSLFIRG